MGTVMLSTSQKDNTLRVWDLQSCNCFRTINLSSELKLELSVFADNNLKVFLIRQADKSDTGNFNFVSCSIKNGKVLKIFEHRRPVNVIQYTRDANENIVFSISEDNAIRKWSADSSALLSTYHTGQRNITAFCLQGQSIYCGDEEGKIVSLEWKGSAIDGPTKLVLSSTPERTAFSRTLSSKNLRTSSDDMRMRFNRSNSEESDGTRSRGGSISNQSGEAIKGILMDYARKLSRSPIPEEIHTDDTEVKSRTNSWDTKESDLVVVQNPLYGVRLPEKYRRRAISLESAQRTDPSMVTSTFSPKVDGKKKQNKIFGVFSHK